MVNTLTPLDRRLLTIAISLAGAGGGQTDASDIFQHLQLRLLEDRKRLVGKTDAYVVQRCRWEASHLTERGRTYRRNFGLLPAPPDADCDIDELLHGDSPLPEDELLRQEERDEAAAFVTALMRRITPTQRVYAGLFARGHSASGIAKILGVSRANVSIHTRNIRQAASDLLAAT